MDEPEEILVNYFKLCYLSTKNYEIFSANINNLKYNSDLNKRHNIINKLTKKTDLYLEIGIETGYTLINTHFIQKVGIDPDPNQNAEIFPMYKFINVHLTSILII
jgi:hypothetical protein